MNALTQQEYTNPLLSDEAKGFFFAALAHVGEPLDGAEIDVNNAAQYAEFSALMDHVCGNQDGIAEYFETTYDNAQNFLDLPEQENDSAYLALKEERLTALKKATQSLQKLAPIAIEALKHENDPTIDDPATAEIASAVVDAMVNNAPAAVDAPKAEPLVLRPDQRVDVASPKLSSADPNVHIEDAEIIEQATPTIWDMDDNALEAVLSLPENKQDEFVAQALSDWYSRYFGADDLDDNDISIIANNYTLDANRTEVLNDIISDVMLKREDPEQFTNFDDNVINNHVELDPESIDRAIENKSDEPGLKGTNSSKPASWLLPAAGAVVSAIVVSGAASMAARGALNAVTGGVGGTIAGAVAGAAGAYASERFKLNQRGKKLVAENPDLANLTKTQLDQEVIKNDKVTTLQRHVAKLKRKLEKNEKKLAQKTKEFDNDNQSKGDHRQGFAAESKAIAKMEKKAATLKSERNKAIIKLERARQIDPAQLSVRKHIRTRVLMGAVLGTAAGGLLSLDPVQETLSNTFNAIGGFISSLAPEAPTVPFEAAPTVLKSALLNAEEAFVAELNPADVVAAAPADNIVPISQAAQNVITQMQASGVEALTTSDIGASLETHFEGDIPAAFEPYISNLASTDPAIRAEASHSIAFLLVEDNTELAKAGHRELASSIMAANALESRLDASDSAVQRSIEGLTYFQPELAAAIQEAAASAGTDLSQIASLAQQEAAGTITLQTPTEQEAVRVAQSIPPIKPGTPN